MKFITTIHVIVLPCHLLMTEIIKYALIQWCSSFSDWIDPINSVHGPIFSLFLFAFCMRIFVEYFDSILLLYFGKGNFFAKRCDAIDDWSPWSHIKHCIVTIAIIKNHHIKNTTYRVTERQNKRTRTQYQHSTV